MTDKELKRLSRLELLELLLTETRENERLREELEKAKKENSIEKSAVLLNETAKQLETALQSVKEMTEGSAQKPKKNFVGLKKPNGKKPSILNLFSKAQEASKRSKKNKPKSKTK
ncbi:MAG: hypothetical protein IIX16_02710 [Clostridia bacterium]|nr:hypothetical protein [Clostridia bacterium]